MSLSRDAENHLLLARAIMSEFQDRITGNSCDRLVGRRPDEEFMAGTLSPMGDESSDLSSRVNINQMGLEFLLTNTDIASASLLVRPRGSFYYRVFPTLDEQRRAFCRECRRRYGPDVPADNDSLVSYLSQQGCDCTSEVEQVYSRLSLDGLEFRVDLGSVYNEQRGIGIRKIQEEIDGHIQSRLEFIQNSDYFYRVIRDKVGVADLVSEQAWRRFIERNATDKLLLNRSWRASIECHVKAYGTHQVRVGLYLTNLSPYDPRDKARITTLFSAGMDVELEGATLQRIELSYFEDDYKYDKTQVAIGHNCSVVVDADDVNRLSTTNLPLYIQNRLKTNDQLCVEFAELASDPVPVLERIADAMDEEAKRWSEHRASLVERGLSMKALKQLDEELKAFDREIRRYRNGIKVIREFDDVRRAFKLMNRTFANSSPKFREWRLFQIVFIVSLIPDVCRSQYSEHELGVKAFVHDVDLLYFPTGGGKTEAFFGVVVFTLFFDRLRGKECGTSAIIKYPLRLLSVQQVSRLCRVLASAELLRREVLDDDASRAFSLGYYVGDKNTPNELKKNDIDQLQALTQSELDSRYRIIDVCPFCESADVHIRVLEDRVRLVHVCCAESCPSNGPLPILIVDREIYRSLPSVIISTLDKLAAIGYQASFRDILGEVQLRCPLHGFSSRGRCAEREDGMCKVDVSEYEPVQLYDPAPTLLIQDELHLVRESLGVYDAHYETLFSYFVESLISHPKPIKIIGATATISQYREQIYHLYLRQAIRFPCASPFMDRNFYAYVDRDEVHRLIFGYAPFGKAIINSVAYSMKHLREILWAYHEEPERIRKIPGIQIGSDVEALELLKDYWILLEYNNVRMDGNKVLGALDDPINTELQLDGIQPFECRKMTGDETFQEVRQILAEIENSPNVFDGPNLIAATSMISHGVDADRFNLMMFFGVPNNTAEYIQAHSRAGRKYSGVIIMVIRPSRKRDISYLRNFVKFHEFRDVLVEPVPINRWATNAVERTFPGVLSAILINHYDLLMPQVNRGIYMMRRLKDAVVSGRINRDELLRHIKMAYGCHISHLGRQYEHRLEQLVDRFFAAIVQQPFDQDMYIIEGLSRLGLGAPMLSLRDTDIPVLIELR